MIARMDIGEEVLSAILNPFDWSAVFESKRRSDQLLGIELRFHPETAAYVRGDDTNTRFRTPNVLCDSGPHDVRNLS